MQPEAFSGQEFVTRPKIARQDPAYPVSSAKDLARDGASLFVFIPILNSSMWNELSKPRSGIGNRVK